LSKRYLEVWLDPSTSLLYHLAMNQADCNYRISAKAIIFEDETKQRFLICQEDNGHWELPGGGIDHGASAQDDIPREIDEEMGLATSFVDDSPIAFFTFYTKKYDKWFANVCFETKVKNLDFTPSSECQEIRFVNVDEALVLDNTLVTVTNSAKCYKLYLQNHPVEQT